MIGKVKVIVFLLIDLICRLFPLNSRFHYFISYHGQYADSPKYISELLHQRDSKVICVWEIGSKSNEKNIPSHIIRVKPFSLKAHYYRSRSKVVIDNYNGYFSGYLFKNNKIRNKILFFIKRKGQINLSTWHGTPIKKIAIDEPKFRGYDTFFSTSDGLLTGNAYASEILERVFFGKIPIHKIGTPRNDILFNNDEELKKRLKEKLNLPYSKKVVLYAPTFREDIDKSGIMQLQSIDFEYLFSILNQRFGGDWVFVYRFHDKVLNAMGSEDITKSGIFNGNLSDDMAEYLYISDVLITDYSSSIFDYALTSKPCFLYCPDLKYYEAVERGFYRDIRSFPCPVAETFEELVDSISSFSVSKYKLDIAIFLDDIKNVEDGEATEKTLAVLQTMKNNKRN